MARYDHNGVSFDTPQEWLDRTIVAFAAPAPPGSKNAPNIVMTQEPMREGDTLRTHADRQLMELAKQLSDFDIVESRETTLGGLPAIFMRFSWVSHFGGLEQSMTLVERNLPTAGRVVCSFTSTARTEDADRSRPVFSQILRSVQFTNPPTGPSMPPPPTSQGPRSSADDAYIPIPGVRRDRR